MKIFAALAAVFFVSINASAQTVVQDGGLYYQLVQGSTA